MVSFFRFRITTLLDVPRSLEYLAYLGYMYEHENQLSAIQGMWWEVKVELFITCSDRFLGMYLLTLKVLNF